MGLIDADKAIEVARKANIPNTITKVMLINNIFELPEVDAIPVEWILNYMNNTDCDSLALMIAEWRTKNKPIGKSYKLKGDEK